MREFDALDEQERLKLLSSLVEENTPNLSWIAKEHRDMLRAVWEGSDEIDGPDGQSISPRLHLTVHGTAERQYASGEPPVVRAVVDKLLNRHWNRHEVMHLVCMANIDELLLALRDEESFNPDRMTRRLLKLAVKSARRREARRLRASRFFHKSH